MPAVTSLVIVNLPKNLNCFVGSNTLDLAGGQLCALFDDGTFKTFSMTQSDVTLSLDTSKEGPTLATVTYGGQSQMFQAYVRTPVIRKFMVDSPPDKTHYLAGEKLDLTGLKLTALYETGEKVPYPDIPAVDHIVSFGEAVYPLTINGISVPIYLKVDDAKIVGIRMGKLPNQTEYLERRDKFNPAGATIIQKYDSGAEQEVPLPYTAVRGFSNLTPGPLTLTVQIGQHSTSFEVKIVEKKPIRATIDTQPFRTSYTEGEDISLDGIRVSVQYDNGETRICDDWDYEPKKAILGEETVTVKVGDATALVAITVAPRQLMRIRMKTLPRKTQYKENLEQLEVDGAELELDFDYGDPVIVPVSSAMVKGFDNRRAGECKVEVQYRGLATEFSVDILPQTLLGITVTQMPEKLDYTPGEIFDRKGLVVSGLYDSGRMEPLRSYSVEPDRPLREGDVAVLITCMTKTTVIPIKVSEMFRPITPGPEPKAWDDFTDPQKPAAPTVQPGYQATGGFQMPGEIPVTAPTTPPGGFQVPGGFQTPGAAPSTPKPSGGFQVPGGFGIPQTPPADGGFAPTSTAKGGGFMPRDEASFLFGPPVDQEPKPEPEEPKKKGGGFWGRKLFQPNTSKYRGGDD